MTREFSRHAPGIFSLSPHAERVIFQEASLRPDVRGSNQLLSKLLPLTLTLALCP